MSNLADYILTHKTLSWWERAKLKNLISVREKDLLKKMKTIVTLVNNSCRYNKMDFLLKGESLDNIITVTLQSARSLLECGYFDIRISFWPVKVFTESTLVAQKLKELDTEAFEEIKNLQKLIALVEKKK